jgi:subtilisin family serine protease
MTQQFGQFGEDMRKTVPVLLLAIVVAFAATPVASQSANVTAPEEARFTPGVVWVKLGPGTGAMAEQAGEWQSYSVVGRLRGSSWVRLSVPQGQEESVAAAFKLETDVAWAEPEFFVHAAGVPNDPSYSSQWNMNKIRAPLAWDLYAGNPETIIAVLDTGTDLNHPDLQDNLWQNFGEIPGNGIDDDQNGRVDDRWGWDVYNNDPTPQDDHGHGTHVSGIAGAVGNNGIGVAGLMWRCRIMPVKVLNQSGSGTYAGVAEGAYYAASNGARVVNMSLAGSDYSQILQDAITDLYLRYGVAFVAAAGNCANGGAGCGSVNPLMYPASMQHVISVASSDSGDNRASTSEYNSSVDVTAPGQSIYSTGLGGGYRSMSGTSMASPHVAALAGLIRALKPEWNPDQVEAYLKVTAAKVGGFAYDENGRNDYFGYGRIDTAAALWSLDPPHLAASSTAWIVRIEPGEPSGVSLALTNDSGVPVGWSVQVTTGADWLQVTPMEGVIAPNEYTVLGLAVPEDLPQGLYRGQFRITSTHPFWDGQAPVVDVYLLVLQHGSRIVFPFVFL